MIGVRKTSYLKRFSKAQAAAELAIFGTLILVAFSMVLIYGQRLDYTQKVKMEAFRKALQRAYYLNSGVAYQLKYDTDLTDLFSGYGKGQPSVASAGASVLWHKGMAGPEWTKGKGQSAFYEINGYILGNRTIPSGDWDTNGDPHLAGIPAMDKTIKDQFDKEQEITVPVGVYKEIGKRVSSQTSSFSEDEKEDSITTTRMSTLKEKVFTDIYFKFDVTQNKANSEASRPNYIYEGDSTDTLGSLNTRSLPFVGVIENNRVVFKQSSYDNEMTKQRVWTTEQ